MRLLWIWVLPLAIAAMALGVQMSLPKAVPSSSVVEDLRIEENPAPETPEPRPGKAARSEGIRQTNQTETATLNGAASQTETTVLNGMTTVTWSGAPITVEFDAYAAMPTTISVKRGESAVLVFKAKDSVPQEGITFSASQVYGGTPGPIVPGASETVTITPMRSFYYRAHSPDDRIRYPFFIKINVYY